MAGSPLSTYLGIDPGGRNAFGWCVLRVPTEGAPLMQCGVRSTLTEVVTALTSACADTPRAAGIDAPLYWVRSGERRSDQAIRRAVSKAGGHSATVNHVNSMRGACLVQGVLAAVELSQRWPGILITESHPKALLTTCPAAREFIQPFDFGSEHERDACLGAFAAWSYDRRAPGWVDWMSKEEATFVPSGTPVAYWSPVIDS